MKFCRRCSNAASACSIAMSAPAGAAEGCGIFINVNFVYKCIDTHTYNHTYVSNKSVHTNMQTGIHTHMWTYVCMHACMHACICLYACVYIYIIYVCICMYAVCMYTCDLCICTYISTYTNICQNHAFTCTWLSISVPLCPVNLLTSRVAFLCLHVLSWLFSYVTEQQTEQLNEYVMQASLNCWYGCM